jgi:hypothetical protein
MRSVCIRFPLTALRMIFSASFRRTSNGGGGLHPDSGQFARAALEDDIHLGPVLVTKVEEADGRLVPARLPPQLLEHEGFEELP